MAIWKQAISESRAKIVIRLNSRLKKFSNATPYYINGFLEISFFRLYSLCLFDDEFSTYDSVSL